MTVEPKSSQIVTLSRTQQLLILVLGLCLTGLWAWRAGFVWHPTLVPAPSQLKVFIEINGDLPRPGLHVFASAPTVQEVWEAAGGQSTLANQIQPLISGTKIVVGPDQAVSLERMSGRDLLTLGLTLDPNLATASDLEAIPGIGPVLAERIVEFREKQGPFKDIEALKDVKGLGAGKLAKIRSFLAIISIEASHQNAGE
jgi:competence protein ComEA